VKANPWWGSVLMPIVFLMSAIVSGIAMVMFIYILLSLLRNERLDMRCLDKIGLFLLVAIIVDFALEALDYIHRIYQSEESIGILTELVAARLFTSLVIVQLLLGMLVPLLVLVLVRIVNFNEELRKLLYFSASVLILLGIFSMRWNVVIGGQLYSKSFRGLMAYKMEITGIESLMTALALLALPFIILTVLFWLLPPRWMDKPAAATA
jgi:Ni/Fe-hydrogenase subunit HybB-like protein